MLVGWCVLGDGRYSSFLLTERPLKLIGIWNYVYMCCLKEWSYIPIAIDNEDRMHNWLISLLAGWTAW